MAMLVGTFFFHRYSILTGLDFVQADTGDSRFVTAILEHWANVLHGTANWRAVPIFWPVKNALAYSEIHLGMGVIHAGLRTFLGLFTAINAQMILLTVAMFLASYAFLARGLALSMWGATLGAAFAAFCWPRYAYLPHLQLQFTAPVPLIFLLVIESLRDGRVLSRTGFAVRMIGAAALSALLLATVVYYAVFAALAVTVALLLSLIYGPSRRHLIAVLRHQWPGFIMSLLVVTVLSTPVVALYLPLVREIGARRWPDVANGLPQLRHFVWMGVENWVWGGLFARWPAAEIEANWPEFRIGVGAVATMAWVAGAVWALAVLLRPRPLAVRSGLIVLLILTGVVLQLSMLMLPNGMSAWWLLWRSFPGANGLRAIARLEMIVTLGMAAWFGALLDGVMRRPVIWPKAVAALLVGACAIEQFGASSGFNGRRMAAFEQGVAAQLAAPCPAVFVTGTRALTPPPILDESRFDADAYLAANPDVVRSWNGSAWSHYQQFGRAEGRTIDAGLAHEMALTQALGYAYTIPLAAVLAHKPVVNGLSGAIPAGWAFGNVFGPNTAEDLARWLALRHQPAESVCTIPIRITLQMIPFVPPGLWP